MKNIRKALCYIIILMLLNSNIVYAASNLHKNIITDKSIEEIAVEVLKISRESHNLSDFKSAIKGYNIILNDSVPAYIKNEAFVCKLLAKEKKHVSLKYAYDSEYALIADKAKEDFKTKKYTISNNKEYNPFDKYFDYEENLYLESDELSFEKNIPILKYNGKFYYNPITAEQYALSNYCKYLNGEDTKKIFLETADFLINYMDENGAFKYGFSYNHYEDLDPGWTSSMAQGQALSVFARAFYLTGDKKYVEAGNKSLKYLITPIFKGGVLDTLEALDSNLKDKIFFQEYVNTISSYTLNGYMFTLIGLYDWSQADKKNNLKYSKVAKDYFSKGTESLKCVLPYYDIGGFTTYDLYFITNKSKPNSAGYYHSVHIEQLDAIYSITKDVYFKNMRDLWKTYVK